MAAVLTSAVAGVGAASGGGSPYISGGYVLMFDGLTIGAAWGGGLDTVIGLMPHTLKANLTINSLNTRTSTGAVGSAIKLALWASDPVTGRPAGLPIAGSNTGQASTGTPSTQTVTVSPALLLQAGRYWCGMAVTTLAPTMTCANNGAGNVASQFGRQVLNSNQCVGFTAPYTYASDIMALNLSGVTLTDLAFGGAPGLAVMLVGTA